MELPRRGKLDNVEYNELEEGQQQLYNGHQGSLREDTDTNAGTLGSDENDANQGSYCVKHTTSASLASLTFLLHVTRALWTADTIKTLLF